MRQVTFIDASRNDQECVRSFDTDAEATAFVDDLVTYNYRYERIYLDIQIINSL
jgi:hypothetical protein